ncbi:MAG: MetQ/NlpA family ABC transporter substrate-binding protein, partial [Oscillospiraceae bacterium]
MKKRVNIVLALSVLAALLLSACGGAASSAASAAPSASTSAAAERIALTVGASPAPHAEILEQVVPILAEQGIDLTITEFNDYILPNTALEDGSLDANYFQHLPYLENFNAENGTDLVSAGGIHIEPLGIYPGKTKTLEELQDGALIGIPNDTTNESRALFLLQEQGLITLKDGVEFKAVPSDIVENPRNLQFKELEAAQLPVSLPDLDFAVINGNYAVGSEIGDTVLATEGAESPYVHILAERRGAETRA